MTAADLAWPVDRLGEAVETLAGAAGCGHAPAAPLRAPATPGDPALLDRWMEAAAASLGLELEAVDAALHELDALAAGAGPALLSAGDDRFLLVVGGAGAGRVALLAPAGVVRRVRVAEVAALLREPIEARHAGEVDRLLDRAGVAASRRPRARRALLAARLAQTRAGGGWLLREPPGAKMRAQAREPRLRRALAVAALAYAGQQALYLAAWWTLGRAALDGRVPQGGWAAWLLLVATMVPLRLVFEWTAGRAAVSAGALLKRRLLAGALSLAPDEIRAQGTGALLGRVLESEALESAALSGGFVAAAAVIDLAAAAIVVAAGAAPILGELALVGWTVLLIWTVARLHRARAAWTIGRSRLTSDLVEQMLGHRTRLAQAPASSWHSDEDAHLDGYAAASQRMERRQALLVGLARSGWPLCGMAALAPAFVVGASPVGMAIGIAGVLLAGRAFARFAVGAAQLVAALIAWRQVRELYDAAARPRPAPALPVARAPEALLEAHDLAYRHAGRLEPTLRAASLRVDPAARILVEGPSGGGKSTLLSLLAALRQPASGVALLGGLDARTLGDREWRRRVALAPQFHENHVLSATLGFNLLLARAWPPSLADVAEAESICRELGLDEVVARMPSGFEQIVGESGWQLSHGERSRVFIARALLQRADVLLLDESFDALDPETLRRTMACVHARARALVVVAHP